MPGEQALAITIVSVAASLVPTPGLVQVWASAGLFSCCFRLGFSAGVAGAGVLISVCWSCLLMVVSRLIWFAAAGLVLPVALMLVLVLLLVWVSDGLVC